MQYNSLSTQLIPRRLAGKLLGSERPSNCGLSALSDPPTRRCLRRSLRLVRSLFSSGYPEYAGVAAHPRPQVWLSACGTSKSMYPTHLGASSVLRSHPGAAGPPWSVRGAWRLAARRGTTTEVFACHRLIGVRRGYWHSLNSHLLCPPDLLLYRGAPPE